MKVSIVIPVFNQLAMTTDCLRDLMLTCGVEKEIIVIDDGSSERISLLKKVFPDIILLSNDQNLGFARTVNKGIREATGDMICLLNNDIRLPNTKWLQIMVENMGDADVVSPAFGRMSLPDFQYLPGEAKTKADINKKEFQYPVFWCALIKRKVFDRIGLVPTQFEKGFWEDVLFWYRANKEGFKAKIVEGTGVTHMYHQTFKKEGYNLAQEYQRKRKIFLEILGKER